MQRSTTTEATFITTSAGQRAIRTVASFVAVALVGTTPWMVSNSTLAQDAPAEPAPIQDDAAAKAAADQAAAEAAAQAAAKAAQVEAARTAAREALSRSEWKKAIDLWSAVLSAVPGDAEAAKALSRAQAALDQGSLINEVGTDIALRKQRAQVEVAAALKGADKSIEGGDYSSAERQVLGAKATLARYEGDFPADEFKSLMSSLDRAFDLARQGSMDADLRRRVQSDAEAERAASGADVAGDAVEGGLRQPLLKLDGRLERDAGRRDGHGRGQRDVDGRRQPRRRRRRSRLGCTIHAVDRFFFSIYTSKSVQLFSYFLTRHG